MTTTQDHGDIAISVKNITKIYKLYNQPQDRLKEALHPFKKKYHHEFNALSDISFDIKKGQTVGIIGKNGAGKSTLLKIITGVLTPTSGSVTIHGKVASLLELGTGFNPEYSGLENIYFQGSLMGFTKEEIDSKVDAILAFADIGEFIHQPVKMYSSGMFARLAFSVAINVDPDILIVDEALSVGDAFFQVKCHERMQMLNNNGTTILFVTHDQGSVAMYCDHVVWLEHGQVQYLGKVKEGLALYAISHYGLKKNITEAELSQEIEQKIAKKILLDDKCRLNKYTDDVVEIIDFDLLDDHGHSTSRIECDQYLTLKIKYKFLKDCNDLPYITISFINDKNIKVYIKNTLQEYIFEPEKIVANQVLSYTSKMRIKLSAGEYIISVGLNTMPASFFKPFSIQNEAAMNEARRIVYGIEYGPFQVARDDRAFSGSYGLCEMDVKSRIELE
jgi:ABC-type polysaccharide/polyol phosphate transport system ATPase subunit